MKEKHFTITDLGNGYFRLTPDKGYLMAYLDKTYKEAVVKDTNNWTAVISGPP